MAFPDGSRRSPRRRGPSPRALGGDAPDLPAEHLREVVGSVAVVAAPVGRDREDLRAARKERDERGHRGKVTREGADRREPAVEESGRRFVPEPLDLVGEARAPVVVRGPGLPGRGRMGERVSAGEVARQVLAGRRGKGVLARKQVEDALRPPMLVRAHEPGELGLPIGGRHRQGPAQRAGRRSCRTRSRASDAPRARTVGIRAPARASP